MDLLFRRISERLSPPWVSLFVVLRLVPFAPVELGVGIGIQIELLSTVADGPVAVALAFPAAVAGAPSVEPLAIPEALAVAAAVAAAVAPAAGTLLLVAVLLLLLFSLTTFGGRRVSGTIF